MWDLGLMLRRLDPTFGLLQRVLLRIEFPETHQRGGPVGPVGLEHIVHSPQPVQMVRQACSRHVVDCALVGTRLHRLPCLE